MSRVLGKQYESNAAAASATLTLQAAVNDAGNKGRRLILMRPHGGVPTFLVFNYQHSNTKLSCGRCLNWPWHSQRMGCLCRNMSWSTRMAHRHHLYPRTRCSCAAAEELSEVHDVLIDVYAWWSRFVVASRSFLIFFCFFHCPPFFFGRILTHVHNRLRWRPHCCQITRHTFRPLREKKYAFKYCRQTIDDVDYVWPVTSLAFHPTFNTFASALSDGTMSILDHKMEKRSRQYPKFPGPVAQQGLQPRRRGIVKVDFRRSGTHHVIIRDKISKSLGASPKLA